MRSSLAGLSPCLCHLSHTLSCAPFSHHSHTLPPTLFLTLLHTLLLTHSLLLTLPRAPQDNTQRGVPIDGFPHFSLLARHAGPGDYFVGSQPVSLDSENLALVKQKR